MRREVRDVAPGLWLWRTEHPDWTPEADWEPLVTSTCVESCGEVAVLDPLAPPQEATEVWRGEVSFERLLHKGRECQIGMPVQVGVHPVGELVGNVHRPLHRSRRLEYPTLSYLDAQDDAVMPLRFSRPGRAG